MRVTVYIFAVMLLSCTAIAAGLGADDPPQTQEVATDCCCSVCEFGVPCCVCNEYDFITACLPCTLKAKSPEIPDQPIAIPSTEIPLRPMAYLQPSTVMPQLSFAFLERWSSTSPRSPKTASPHSANSNSRDSSRTSRRSFRTSQSLSDAEESY